ncbi:MAG: preprotein translocase subunit SecG [Synergistaceae bacterium]|nr:preprotein translocase subunit SecG [Synergistota bacterium]NLM71504.1 preprotein translocase subunit SecG [Synergistaceae bacterium]
MKTFFGIVHILLCVALSAIVLLQQRKEGGFSGIFGGGTQTDMSASQWQRFTGLTKLTVILTTIFMVMSVVLVLL